MQPYDAIQDPTARKKIQEWMEGPYDARTKEEIQNLLKNDPEKTLVDAFCKDLAFGTAGMRGIMGVGTNRINLYTIRKAAQALANYIKKTKSSVFIGYDVRHLSKEFAEETARVLSCNGIEVFLTKTICPTPLVSFGCRIFKCSAGVMITASHNPAQYNGFKVFGDDGAQITHPHDSGIMEEFAKVTRIENSPSAKIHLVDGELDDLYLKVIKSLQLHPEISGSDLKIIYTPLHGTGIRIIPKALQSWGFTNIHLVEKQSHPDPDFSFAKNPNPEEAASLALGIKQLQEEKGDILIATDPDADRVGVVCPGHHFTGNQIACLLLQHITKSLNNGLCVKTIVTTELFRKIAEKSKNTCIDVLTGFKYIAEKIRENEHQFIFGAEESCGYLFGSLVRDKDAISSACLIAEMAALAKKKNKTLLDELYQLYRDYGVHRESLVTIAFSDSLDGMHKMQKIMQTLRKNPPTSIVEKDVVKTEDFLPGILSLPPSDVLRFWLEDQTKIVIRPSGTEPKIKVYLEVVEQGFLDIEMQIKSCDKKLKNLSHFFKNLFL